MSRAVCYSFSMLRKTLQATLIATAILTTACTAPDTHEADAAAIQAADEQWAAVVQKKDLDATVSYYAADGVLLPPSAPIAKDAKGIRDVWTMFMSPDASLTWKATKTEASGNLGYAYGTYHLVIKDPKSPVDEIGKFSEVWKRQADGKWKCIVDAFNSDQPVPTPAPEVKK